jgi:hypothetical protein
MSKVIRMIKSRRWGDRDTDAYGNEKYEQKCSVGKPEAERPFGIDRRVIIAFIREKGRQEDDWMQKVNDRFNGAIL